MERYALQLVPTRRRSTHATGINPPWIQGKKNRKKKHEAASTIPKDLAMVRLDITDGVSQMEFPNVNVRENTDTRAAWDYLDSALTPCPS